MITVILNCYRRPQNLQAQIESLLKQTIPPEQIFIWMNDSEELHYFDWGEVEKLIKEHNIRTVPSNYNWKYCGRFALACLVDTEFTAIFDDDTIPGPEWFENCINTHHETPGIMGGVGVRLRTDCAYQPNIRDGWVNANEQTVEVDLVGHAWFFPAEYIKYMWMEKPVWDNGEDMHFSAMCQIHGGINTYVPPHPMNDRKKWSSLYGVQLGIDAVASSAVRNHNKFYKERNAVVQRLRGLGWRLQRDKAE